MSEQPERPRTALDKVRHASLHGKKAPKVAPTELPAGRIKIIEEVFQRRGSYLTGPRSQLIADIAKELKKLRTAQHLEPVTVWWAGRWLLVDGHHRMAAVRRSLGPDAVVPVVVLGGDLTAALAASVGLNRKAKASMAKAERLNAAWFLTINAPEMSRAEVVTATGVSDGTVAEQRRVLKVLQERFAAAAFDDTTAEDPERLSWREAQAAAAGRPVPTWDAAEGRRAAVAKALHMLASSGLAKLLATNPEAFTEAVSTLDPDHYADPSAADATDEEQEEEQARPADATEAQQQQQQRPREGFFWWA